MTMWYRGWRVIIPFCAVISLSAGWPSDAPEVRAATVYSYIDDQGNPVFTDKPETIPEKYRAKVQTHERSDAGKQSSSAVATVKDTVVEKVKRLGATMPSLKMNLKTLGSFQSSDVLTSAGIAALVLLCVMYFSKKSPMIRLLALGLLIVLAIGTPVLMYTSDGGAMDVMKKKAAATEQAQHDRLQQVPQ